MESQQYYENLRNQAQNLIEGLSNEIQHIEQTRELWIRELEHANAMLETHYSEEI